MAMQFARALLGSLGASLSLVLAGTLAMTSLSALVAFNGLPGLQADRASDARAAVLVAAQRSSADATELGDPIVVRARRSTRPAASLAALVRRSARAGREQAPVRRTQADRPAGTQTVVTDPAITPPPDTDPTPGRTTAQATPSPDPEPATPVRQATGQPLADTTAALGSTVTQTGVAVGQVVQPVLPTVAPIVEQVTAALGDVLTGTGQIVTGTVTGLAGFVQP